MVTKRNLVLVALITLCLAITMFSVLPIFSSGAGVYNSWYDVNDDGKIDGKDIALVASVYGTLGDLINKTELLIEVNNTYTQLLNTINGCNASLIDLQGRVTTLENITLPLNDTISTLKSRIDTLNASLLNIVSSTNSLNASVINLQNRTTMLEGEVFQLQSNVTLLQTNIASLNSTVTLLQTTVSTLQTNFALMNASLVQLNQTVNSLNSTFTNSINNLQAEINVLNATRLGTPNWDSLWFGLSTGSSVVLYHNLGTTNVLVYMIGYNGAINQIQYGGDDTQFAQYGAYWSQLTATSITITRQGNDVNWQSIRVMIWKLP